VKDAFRPKKLQDLTSQHNPTLLEVAGSIVFLFADDLILLHPLNSIFNMHQIGFLLRATEPE